MKNIYNFIVKPPIIILIHLFMLFLSILNIGLFQGSGIDNIIMKDFFCVVSAIYTIFFVEKFLEANDNFWFYYTVMFLAILFLFMWAIAEYSSIHEIRKFTSIRQFVGIIVWFTCFLAWPILTIPYFLNDYGVSWQMIRLIYLTIFIVIIVLKKRKIEEKKEKL